MTNPNLTIEEFIASVRNLSPLMMPICTLGSCYRLYKLIETVFPSALPYFDGDKHVVTRFGDSFYDITGKVEGEFYMMSREQEASQKHYVCDVVFTAINYG